MYMYNVMHLLEIPKDIIPRALSSQSRATKFVGLVGLEVPLSHVQMYMYTYMYDMHCKCIDHGVYTFLEDPVMMANSPVGK